jgi:hypothetical protein
MASADEKPKIVTDEDWKHQARQEKEKLVSDPDPESEATPGQLPPADFTTHVESIMIQILYCLGAIKDPGGSEVPVNLDLAKHHIDILQMLEEKTRDNLTDEEGKLLSMRQHEARMQFVAVSQTG